MIREYKYKIISKAVQILVTYYSKNKDRKNQMRCVYFQGALNEYIKKTNGFACIEEKNPTTKKESEG